MKKEFMKAYISEALIPRQFGWNEQQIGESATGPIMALVLEGEFQRAEEPNRNKRVYSRNLLGRETDKLQKFIEERNGLLMGMDHPLPGDTDAAMTLVQRMGMENSCAMCTHLEMNNNVVYGRSKVLEGDHGTGDKLAAMVRAGFKPGVSSRGIGGKPQYDPKGWTMVPEDYSMITYDYVSQPSTFNAILSEQINEEIALFESNISHDDKKKMWEVLTDLSNKYMERNYGKRY